MIKVSILFLALIASSLCEDENYKYIVIGGGSAACLNAKRLSEHGKVLLLERGMMMPEDNVNARVPALLLDNWQPPYTRDILMKKNPPLDRVNLIVADVLGGGGEINGMISHTGSEGYWKSWDQTKWNYERDIVPAYDRLKQRLSLMKAPYIPEIASWFVSSGANVSFVNDDLNDLLSNPTEGFGDIYLAIKPSPSFGFERDNTLYAYLNGSKKVDVSLSSHVTRINFNRRNVAVSVEYIKDGKLFIAKAKKGIILSAGAIGSAEILMRSGVGPCPSLEALGIECVSDLPVGRGLRDHHTLQLSYFTPCITPQSPGLAFSPGTQVAGFLKSSPSRPYPDIQYTFIPTFGPGIPLFGLSIFLVDSDVRGNVTLASSDPLKPSIVQYDYSGTAYDNQRLAQAVEKAEAFMSTPPFSACMGVRQQPPPSQDLPSWIPSNSASGYHPTGTNLIGHVVDQDLKVKGVHNLYVLDSSIIPLSNCNTQIPTLIAAERGIDLIIASTL